MSSEPPVWLVIKFKIGQSLECTVTQEVLDKLSKDFADYCASGSPRGGWYEARPNDERAARVFLQFAEILYIG